MINNIKLAVVRSIPWARPLGSPSDLRLALTKVDLLVSKLDAVWRLDQQSTVRRQTRHLIDSHNTDTLVCYLLWLVTTWGLVWAYPLGLLSGDLLVWQKAQVSEHLEKERIALSLHERSVQATDWNVETFAPVGLAVGVSVGNAVGAVEGCAVGQAVGAALGAAEGTAVGDAVGGSPGLDGAGVIGDVGLDVGQDVGAADGTLVGQAVGLVVGFACK